MNRTVRCILCLAIPQVLCFAVTPACLSFTGWSGQVNPQADTAGLANVHYPEASNTTYFVAAFHQNAGDVVTIRGRYPFARFMSLEIYPSVTVSYINDSNIAPDPGQNNPFVSGTDHGTYTAYLVFGPQPDLPAQNTLYAGTQTDVVLAYRVYHTTDPNDPAGGVPEPRLWMNGQQLDNCPVQPVIQPTTSTPWGRLDQGNWIGAPPTPAQQLAASYFPKWFLLSAAETAGGFSNGANYYLQARLSRQYLAPNTSRDIFVLRFKAPTYPNTRKGEPAYLRHQVRFWSVCTNDNYTTNVVRCVPDDSIVLDANGYAVIVVSDPGSKPSAAALARYRATWLAWGALALPTDVVFDDHQAAWGTNTPVHFYSTVMFRQTLANSAFTQSFAAVFALPLSQQQAAMGAYWPVSGYCSSAGFESYGIYCLNH